MTGASSAPRVALTVVAKFPSERESKTRLSPVLDGAQRRALAEAMLLDKIDQARSIEGAELVLAYAPSDARTAFEALVRTPAVWIDQRDGSLGDRLARTAEALFASGYSAVILVGADSPTLPTTRLQTAVRALAASGEDHASDFVIGPAEDGGYYLLGMRRFESALFTGIDWSTERVFSQTMTALRKLGARPYLLEPCFDVDLPRDLERLRESLERDSSLAPRTAAAIAGFMLVPKEPRLR